MVRKSGSVTTRPVSIFCARKQIQQLAAAAIRPDRPDDRNPIGEFAQVAGDVGRAPGVK